MIRLTCLNVWEALDSIPRKPKYPRSVMAIGFFLAMVS